MEVALIMLILPTIAAVSTSATSPTADSPCASFSQLPTSEAICSDCVSNSAEVLGAS